MSVSNDLTTCPPQDDFAAELSRFSCASNFDTLSDEAIAAVKVNLFDTLACAVAGSSAAAVAEVRDLVTTWGGAPQATVLVFGDQLPAHHAAWLNGTMAHARDYDDTHDAAVLHAGVSVVPAALAAADLAGGVSGTDLIVAVAVGLEAISRLGIATTIGIVESGFMYTSLFGHFAATLAAARVLGLDQAQTVNALGIAYSQVAGNHQVTRDAALTKRMQPGFAAMAALVSVQLAQRGIRGAQATFDGADGFLRVYLRDRCDRAALRDKLGHRFDFLGLSYKPYPCCRFNHTTIEAVLQLRDRTGLQATEVRRVRVGLTHQAYQAVCTPVEVRRAPRTIVQAQFSIPYAVACALVDGSVGLQHFTDAALARPDLLALAHKVETHVDESIEKAFSRNVTPAHVCIDMQDGSHHVVRLDVPLGSPGRPMSRRDFDVKAQDCFLNSALPMPLDAHHRLRAWVEGLEQSQDARSLREVIAPYMHRAPA